MIYLSSHIKRPSSWQSLFKIIPRPILTQVGKISIMKYISRAVFLTICQLAYTIFLSAILTNMSASIKIAALRWSFKQYKLGLLNKAFPSSAI